MDEDKKKSIDEAWKDSVDKEREKEKQTGKQAAESMPPETTFTFFISTLALQASIFLGNIPNPVTNKKEKNLGQAKFIIDTLGMLEEKTHNNLSDEEGALLESALYELRLQYVEATKDN